MRVRMIAVLGLALVGAVPSSTAQAAATVTVDTVEDSYDGTCADDCSIRDAIVSVDSGGIVRIAPGYYELSLSGAGGIDVGDLDVDRPLTVAGIGSLGAFIDASGLGDRAFDLSASVELVHLTLIGGSEVGRGGLVRIAAGTARLADSTLIGGVAQRGGAVAIGDGAAVRIVRSWVSKNLAYERGGALFVRGHATVVRSTISEGQSGAGGGAWVGETGSLQISDSTISAASVQGGGGGLHVRGFAVLRSATVARNRAAVGGAVLATATAEVVTAGSVFEGNEATDRAPTCSRRLTTGGHNVADGFGCGLDGPGDLAGIDPMLGPLRQNGRPDADARPPDREPRRGQRRRGLLPVRPARRPPPRLRQGGLRARLLPGPTGHPRRHLGSGRPLGRSRSRRLPRPRRERRVPGVRGPRPRLRGPRPRPPDRGSRRRPARGGAGR
jgi:hypothetical protein